jgi:hypothetical protein
MGGGDTDKLRAIIQSEAAQIPFALLPLQDCVDLAVTLMDATIRMQRVSVTLRGVGGPVDVITITRMDGVRVIRAKEVGINEQR